MRNWRLLAPRVRRWVMVVVIIGLYALGSWFLRAGYNAQSPGLDALVLTTGELPSGYVPFPALVGPLTEDAAASEGLPSGFANDANVGYERVWKSPEGPHAIEILAMNRGNDSRAADFRAYLAARSDTWQPFEVTGVDGALGHVSDQGQTPTGIEAARISFCRGAICMAVTAGATGTGDGAALERLAEPIARAQAAKLDRVYTSTRPRHVPSLVVALGIVAAIAAYLLVVGLWGFVRDPLRRVRGRGSRETPTARPAAPGTVDVTAAAGRLRRNAAILLGVQVIGGVLMVLAVLLSSTGPRVVCGAIGAAAVLAVSWFRSRRAARSGQILWALRGDHRLLAGALNTASVVLLAFGALMLGASALAFRDPGWPSLAAAAFCALIIAAMVHRGARRLSQVSAEEYLARDPRPPVVYLRSFGDDRLRLRAAILGRPTLVERLSPNRFDSFEEVLVRHLTRLGPVIAVNPPGLTLAPLGAARASIPEGEWQSAVAARIDEARLVVLGAPPGAASPGLIWEMQQVAERARWQRSIIVVPPVSDDRLRARWLDFAQAGTDQWPFRSVGAIDPARILVLLPRASGWLAICAHDRSEWAYAAAIRAASDLLAAAGPSVAREGAAPFGGSRPPPHVG